MDDVTAQPTVEQPVETTTTPVVEGGTETPETPQAPQGDDEVSKYRTESENYKKALKAERERRRALERDFASERGARQLEGQDPDDIQNIFSHPEVQKMYLKNAEYELKEGAKEILKEYPQIPKSIVNAIVKNPRGYVNPDTTDVETALYDIRDYLEAIAPEFGEATTPQPKPVTIAQNNRVVGQGQDVNIQAILEIPPEDWTEAQDKAVSDYLKANKKR